MWHVTIGRSGSGRCKSYAEATRAGSQTEQLSMITFNEFKEMKRLLFHPEGGDDDKGK